MCPECKTAIKGQLKAIWHAGKEDSEEQPFHFDLDIKNATNVDNIDPLKATYKYEVSADFLVNKDTDNEQNLQTPFMLNQQLHQGKFQEDTQRFYQFYNKWQKQWNDIKINWGLCRNKKYDLAYAKIEREIDVDLLEVNELAKNLPIQDRCTMLFHQKLIFFLFGLLDVDTLPTYSKMKDEISKLLKKKEFNKVLTIMAQEKLEKYEQKLSEQIINFVDKFPLLLPVYNASMLKDIP